MRVGRRTGVNLRASSPVWPVGSSTFARVLACRLKGVSRRVDWRAAVNRVFEARKEVVFELWRRESKTKIPGKNLTEWRLASNQRSSFSVFKNQRRRFIEPCFPSLLFVLLLEIPRGHETALQKTQFARIHPRTHARLVLSYVPLTACTHHPGSANPESTPTPPAGSDPCRRSRGNLGESRT